MLGKNKKVGEYTLLEKLGIGGFGEVWKAEKRTELSVSFFALKFFRPNDDEKIDLKNVKKEVQTWQSLSGLPNIISVIEANIFEDYVYIVSDFAEGGSLDKWLKENGGKAKSVEEAVRISRQILQGLEGMHNAGFVHRDLKPANILIKKGVVYLADFGISRQMKTHSKTNGTAGTYEFMPPEAFDKNPTVSIHTDIWAAGVILQKLLTGQSPFPQEEIPSLITAILMHEPEPLPLTVPQELRKVVKKALEKNRENRFQWTREMGDALRDAVNEIKINKSQNVFETKSSPQPNLEKTVKLEFEPNDDWREITREAKPKKNGEILKLPIENQRQEQLTVPLHPQQFQINKIKRNVVKIPQSNLAKNPQPKNKAGFGSIQKIGVVLTALVLTVSVAAIGYNWGGISVLSENKTSDSSANNAAKKPVVNTNSNYPKTFKNSAGIEFIKIPAGSFLMGSPANEWQREKNESPQHEVNIGYEFYLGKYEVTQDEYEKVTGTNPSAFKNCPRCPVENLTWDDAKDFIVKLNAKNDGYEYRLPSEAEWEYAARAGSTTPFGIGDGNNLSSEQANFDGNHPFKNAPKGKYFERTTTVGSYQPNAFGLYDMHGNVWEWCEDIYQDNYNGLNNDGSANVNVGNSALRVLRGGAWVNLGNGLRSAVRVGVSPSNRFDFNGLRVAITLK